MQSSKLPIIASAVIIVAGLAVGIHQLSSPPPAAPAAPKAPASASLPAPAPAPAPKPAAPATPAPRRAAEPEEAPAKPVAAEPVATRTREQAVAALMALPELQAWSAQIEKNSKGKTHGAVIEYDPTPRKLNGKNYYQFSYVENTPEAAMRWESFLVSSSDDEILVEDGTTDEVISLVRWRREKHPMKRITIDG